MSFNLVYIHRVLIEFERQSCSGYHYTVGLRKAASTCCPDRKVS